MIIALPQPEVIISNKLGHSHATNLNCMVIVELKSLKWELCWIQIKKFGLDHNLLKVTPITIANASDRQKIVIMSGVVRAAGLKDCNWCNLIQGWPRKHIPLEFYLR